MMRTSRRFGALVLLPVLLAVAGCRSHIRYVDLDSKPSGATVYVNGEKKGVTRAARLKLEFKDSPRVLIQLNKPRYRPIFQFWSRGEVPDEKIFMLEVE